MIKKAITAAFASVATAVEAKCIANGWKDGACFVGCLIINEMVYIINLGDSKVS